MALPAEPAAATLLPLGCRVLAVGEGDYAFSEALAAAHQPLRPGALVATSLDTEAEVISKYACGAERLQKIRASGAQVIGGIDARHLSSGPLAGSEPFDRIVFNFPLLPVTEIDSYNGLYDVHLANRALLVEFLRSAAGLLSQEGLVIIASKDCFPYSWWRVEAMPQWSGGELSFVGMLPWQYTEYPSLYSGPCNVNRDASVKPTDAVIFIFARAGTAAFESFSGSLVDVWNHRKGRVRLSPSIGQMECAVCNVKGLSPPDFAQHSAGKIHRKRVALEERWQLRLNELGADPAAGKITKAAHSAKLARRANCSRRLRRTALLLLAGAMALAYAVKQVERRAAWLPVTAPSPMQPRPASCQGKLIRR